MGAAEALSRAVHRGQSAQTLRNRNYVETAAWGIILNLNAFIPPARPGPAREIFRSSNLAREFFQHSPQPAGPPAKIPLKKTLPTRVFPSAREDKVEKKSRGGRFRAWLARSYRGRRIAQLLHYTVHAPDRSRSRQSRSSRSYICRCDMVCSICTVRILHTANLYYHRACRSSGSPWAA